METNPFRLPPAGAKAGARPAPAGSRGAAAGSEGSTPSDTGLLGRCQAWTRTAVAGKTWWLRAPVLLLLLWMFRGFLRDRTYHSLFDGITLGFHEAGHAAFMWLGSDLLTTAGGTIFQLGVPLLAALYLLLKQRDPFGATVGAFWLGTSLVGAGVYAADARAQVLPLVSPFGPVDSSSHDWTIMLLRFGKISRDQEIGSALAGAGLVTMALSLALAVWVLRVMATSQAPVEKGAGAARSRAGTKGRSAQLPLYSAAEEERLGAFLAGKPVVRVLPKRLFKRSGGAPPEVEPQGGARPAPAALPARLAPPAAPARPTKPAAAQPPANPTAKPATKPTARPAPKPAAGAAPASEEERFRKFLERDGKGGRA